MKMARRKCKQRRELIRKVWKVKQDYREGWNPVLKKLEECEKSLVKWKKENKSPSDKELKQTTDRVLELEGEEELWDMEELRALQNKALEIMEVDELKWKQRAHEAWLNYVDMNSKYFHACVNQRRRSNKILGIVHEEGVACENPELVEKAFVSHFRGVLNSSNPSGVAEVVAELPRKITADMNLELVKEVTMEEVSLVLNQMSPLKAPRLNGFNASFYQEHWSDVGKEVVLAIIFFFLVR